jgi:hypothetical protein
MHVQANATAGADDRVQAAPARHLTLTARLWAGPDEPAAGEIVRFFGSVAYACAGLAAAGERERGLRWRQLAAALSQQGSTEAAGSSVGARVAAAQEAPAVLALFAAADGTLLHEQQLHGMSGGLVRIIPASTAGQPLDGIGAICRYGPG